VDPQHPVPELILWAYRRGIFPMVDPRTRRVEWFSPDPRGILPLDRLHVPRRLARTLRRGRFTIRSDQAFESVIRACAASRPGRRETWLDDRLIDVYLGLYERGHAHSVEAWLDDRLVGGLYGIHIGAAFFGESMFSAQDRGGRDSSKVCLVQLAHQLRDGAFLLFDTQFRTPHLARFGCIEIARPRYLELLEAAVAAQAGWPTFSTDPGHGLGGEATHPRTL
jgi:leucyl/phenylalanyl-tRNA--protein transferase